MKNSQENPRRSEFPAGGQGGHLVRKGIKRTSRIFGDKTNFNAQFEAQAKKLKQFVNKNWKENIAVKQPGVVSSVCIQVQEESSRRMKKTSGVHRDISKDFDQETETCKKGKRSEHQPPNVIFSCDILRFKMDVHLFPKEYILPITRSIDNNEKKYAELFPCPNYFDNQKDIKPRMRTILLAWMTEVHIKFELKEVVLWAAFQICDRFLSKVNINRKKLQLVGCTSLWIASKYHEIYPPLAADLVHVSDNAFTKNEIVAMEIRICNVLSYQFSIPNAFQFLDRYTNVAMESVSGSRLKKRVKWLARYGLERFHLNVRALKYCPSLLAAGALFAALKLTSNRWSRSCENCSGYSQQQLLSDVSAREISIFELIKGAIMNFESKSHQAVIHKYKTPDRGSVSTLRRKGK